VNQLNWREPPDDDNRGGNNKYDIYIRNIQGGACLAEVPVGWNYEWAPSYIEITNGYNDMNKLRSLVTHEFNHACQIAYTYRDGIGLGVWFYENTSVWMEYIVYPAFENYLIWLTGGPNPITLPFRRINFLEPGYFYGGFLWPLFLSEWTKDTDIVRSIWERMGDTQGNQTFSDINYILSTEHNTDIEEAYANYAVWRWFTGSRADTDNYFSISNKIQIEAEPTTLPGNLEGNGGCSYHLAAASTDLVNINFTGAAPPLSFSANAVRDLRPVLSEVHKIPLTNNSGSLEVQLSETNGVVFIPVRTDQGATASYVYSITSVNNKRVVRFENRFGTSNLGGQLLLDNTYPAIQSGDTKILFTGSSHAVKTLNERFSTPFVKQNNWNNQPSLYFLSRNFPVTSTGDVHQYAQFGEMKNATIRNVIDGISFNDGVPIRFNDPWFVKDANDNQSGMGDFIPFTSPYYPTGKFNQSTGGVFLDQNPTYDPNLPIYSVRAPLIKDEFLTTTGRTHKFYFQGWSWSGASLQQVGSNPPGFDQKAVVFTGSNAEVKAHLKGTQLSNNSLGYNTNGQRKSVKCPNQVNSPLYNAYESMGKVWLEASTDNGQTWRIENNGQPISGSAGSRSPSLYTNGTTLLITYQELNPNKIKILSYYNYDQSLLPVGEFIIGGTSDLNLKPSSVFCNDATIVTTYELGGTIYCFWGLWSGSFVHITADWNTMYSPAPLFEYNYSSPSIASDYNSKYHLAASRTSRVDVSDIVYKKFRIQKGHQGDPTWCNDVNDPNCAYPIFEIIESNVSAGCSYPYNYLPSISLVNFDKPIVSWVAGVNTGGIISYKTSVTRRGPAWGDLKIVGSDVQFVNNNSANTSAEKTVVVWSQGSPAASKWIKRTGTVYINPQNLSHSGIHSQVTTGSDYQYMTAMVFNANSLPYYFTKSTTNFSYTPPAEDDKLSKITDSDTLLTFGRSGISDINGIEFIFNIGDILAGDSIINFIEKPDTLLYNSDIELNQWTRTEDFYLSPNSTFYFSNFYKVVQKSDPDTALTENDAVNFKAELINAITGEIMGTFDNITYSKNNLEKYDNVDYEVDCSGITPGNYFLRLATTVTTEAQYSLANVVNDNTTLSKKSYNKVSFQGNDLPLTYELYQNYPNPFNPSTTIRYQVPEDGFVTLKIFDILGKEVTTLINENKLTGRYEINFDAGDLASGVYLYRIQVNDFTSVKKMVFLK
jgi:hypothetical protein